MPSGSTSGEGRHRTRHKQQARTEQAVTLVNTQHFAMRLPDLEELQDNNQVAGVHTDNMKNRLTALEHSVRAQAKHIQQLQQEQVQALASRTDLQQKMLLGQIAYTISDVLEDYIFGETKFGSFVPISLSEFAANTVDLSDEQKSRWTAAKSFLTKSMSLKEIIEADKYLRWLTNGPALEDHQIQETSATDLHTWAGLHCRAKAVAVVQKYLQVLNKISNADRPLVPSKSLAALIHVDNPGRSHLN